jgi:hypothetical protein
MSIEDEMSILRGWAERGVEVVALPSRVETINHIWGLMGSTFNYDRGWMTIRHDLGAIEPVRFEMRRYGNTIVVEAEGVIVRRVPIINFRRVD